MDMVCVRICVNFPWDSSNDIILLHCARKFEVRTQSGWCDGSLALVVIRFGDDPERLFEHFPKFDCFVWGSRKWLTGSNKGEKESTVGGQQEMSSVLPFAPLDLVDLFFDF